MTPKPQVIRFRFDLRVSAHYFQARILWLSGCADQALRVVERNIEEGRTVRAGPVILQRAGPGGMPGHLLAGDLEAAERYGAMLIEHTERHPVRLWNLWARAFIGMVMARGAPAGRGAVLRDGLEQAGDARFLPRFLFLLGELASCSATW